LAAFESDGPQLYGVEPSGVTYVRGFFLLKTKREFMVYFRVIMVLLLAKHNKRLKLN